MFWQTIQHRKSSASLTCSVVGCDSHCCQGHQGQWGKEGQALSSYLCSCASFRGSIVYYSYKTDLKQWHFPFLVIFVGQLGRVGRIMGSGVRVLTMGSKAGQEDKSPLFTQCLPHCLVTAFPSWVLHILLVLPFTSQCTSLQKCKSDWKRCV